MVSRDQAPSVTPRRPDGDDVVDERARADVRRVLDAAQDGMGIVRDGRWSMVNPALARQLGAPSPEALTGVEVLPGVHAADRDVADLRLRSARASHGLSPGVVRFVKLDGSSVALEVSLTPVEGIEGPGAVLLVTRDLTERRRLFSRLVAADRGAALGTLAASIAHGINTPLAQVYGNASYARELSRRLMRDLDATWDRGDAATLRTELRNLSESIGQLHEGVTAVANITRSLGLFTQREAEDGVIEPGRVLDAAVDLTENIIRHRARLTCEVAVMPAIRGSESAIGHLLLSALLASAQAIPEGDAKHHEVHVRAAPDGGGVRIEITDTGAPRAAPGDSDASDPLAALDRGATPASFALALCRALAVEVGGSFDVTPLDRGTRVTIHLVAAEAGRGEAQHDAHRGAVAGETVRGRVLVIDDDPVLLSLMCKILSIDHDVDGNAEPHDALARIERGERYDVILCDLMMPTMSGVDLYTRIARFAPHVARRMMFLTAGAFTEKARSFLASGDVTWFEKPIEPDRLREIVSERVAAAR